MNDYIYIYMYFLNIISSERLQELPNLLNIHESEYVRKYEFGPYEPNNRANKLLGLI